MPSNPHIRASRSGYSLIELVAASAILAATLVPALELVRDGIDLSEESAQRQLLTGYAVSQIEQYSALSAATWTTGSYSGSMAADGHNLVRYETSCSDAPAVGGIPDQLMVIQTTTFYDNNGDGLLSSGELSCNLQTKLCRFPTYEALSP